MSVAPSVERVVETGVYVRDLEKAEKFYSDVLGLEFYSRVEGRHAFYKVGRSMLLLFNAAATSTDTELPPHGAAGSQHFAFQVATFQLSVWREWLKNKGVTIESEVDWPQGGHSIYFRDPDGNLVELISSGVWPVDE